MPYWDSLGGDELVPRGSPHVHPTLRQLPGPVLIHQLHDACPTLRLSWVQLLQRLFPLGDGITDLE